MVATNVTETANLIEHGKFGYLAEPENSEEYAEHLIRLLQFPELAQKMGVEFAAWRP